MRIATLGVIILASAFAAACGGPASGAVGAKSTKMTLVRTDLQPCDQANACPSGQSCVRYEFESGSQLLCADTGNECEAIACEKPGECVLLLSQPPQLGCMYTP